MSLNLSAATALLDTLALGGVAHAVVSPGSRNTPLILGISAQPAMESHVVLDERSAGFFALGLARGTRSPVILACTSGSALAHYLPALIEASQSRVPLIVLSADRPGELQDAGAPQTIRQGGIFGEFVRWAGALDAPSTAEDIRRWRSLGIQALGHSLGAEPGPVHLNVPFREPLWSAGDGVSVRVRPGKWTPSPTLLSPAVVEEVATEIEHGVRGVIVCGPQTHDPRSEKNGRYARALVKLGDALGWPVVAEPASGIGYGPHDKSGIITTADAMLRSEKFAEWAKVDFVLRFGGLPTSKALHRWLGKAGQDRGIIVDPHGRWSDPFHGAHQLISAPATPFAEELAGCVSRRKRTSTWFETWQNANDACSSILTQISEKGIWEGSIARAVVQTQPEGSALQVGNSMPIRDVESFGGALERNLHLFTSRGANGIDGSVSTAMGLARGRAHSPTTLLVGDLSFLHDLSGLSALSDVGAALRIVVVDNGGGGIFRFLPISQHPTAFERFYLTPPRTQVAEASKGLGFTVHAPETLEALYEILRRPFTGIEIVHVLSDGEFNIERHKEALERCKVAVEGLLPEEEMS